MRKYEKINKVVQEYFDKNKQIRKILAKELMPEFLKAGIFKSNNRDGLPLRNLFRTLDAKNELYRIPFLLAERKIRNTNWYFIRTNKIIVNSPKPVNKPTKENTLKFKKSSHQNSNVLQDLLQPNLDIVFCGTAVGNKSAATEAYYAGSGNKFYPILYKIGLTSTLLHPKDYKNLLQYKIGLTDLVKQKSGNDDVLKKDDYDVDGFIKKMLRYQPKIICFNGKASAAVFLYKNKSKTKEIDYGLLNNTIGKTKLFVAPSTSGSANKYWDETIWVNLKNEIKNV